MLPAVLALLALQAPQQHPFPTPPPPIDCASLVRELLDAPSRAVCPQPPYRALRSTSYNRASVAKDAPGWFADSDGTGFLREEDHAGRHEWVIHEQQGPGCLTKFWTPFFYYDFGNRVGPNVRVYLDGAVEPLFVLPLIELVTENHWPQSYGTSPPRRSDLRLAEGLGGFTARAGNLLLPIPFANGCKVTLDDKPFYYAIDSRAYPPGTAVRTATLADLRRLADERRADPFGPPPPDPAPGGPRAVLRGPCCITTLAVRVDPALLLREPALLRRLVLRARFDGEDCIWCPLGDLFAAPDRLRDFRTRMRDASEKGLLHLRWPMPCRESAELEIVDLAGGEAPATLGVTTTPWTWDARSMHFHVTWRPDDVVAGDHFEDWNFLDVTGEGVFVGDQWTVLNLTDGWWGEGDEKIYVDDSVARGFPDHFGTGSEDYYGWAGGVNPTRADVFSQPLLANVCVGSTDHDSTRGFNVLVRDRALDAIPFRKRFVFDMEASPGVDQRRPSDLLGYSAVCFWYGRPGTVATRGADPAAALRPAMSLAALSARSQALEQQARGRR